MIIHRIAARLAPWLTACALSVFVFPAAAADQDGDGISDAVETAVGLDPEVAEFGAVYQLTAADDFTRYNVYAVEDADGNFHVTYGRGVTGDTWRNSGVWETVYMMVGPDGEVLIDEVVVNPTSTGDEVRSPRLALDADGMVVIAWNSWGQSPSGIRVMRLDPSLAPQDGTAPALNVIEDLAEVQVDAANSWRNHEFMILPDGGYLFWSPDDGRMMRLDTSGALAVLPDAPGNPFSTDTNWNYRGHGTVHGFLDELGLHVVAQYCGDTDDEMEDCVPAYALYDVDTFEFLISPTALQVPDFRKAHGSGYSVGHDAAGNVYTTWIDKRGSFDYQDCNACYSQGSAWFMTFDPSKAGRNGGQADFASIGKGEVRLGGRKYMQSFTDPAGVTHVLYWDNLGFDYQSVSSSGVASAVVPMSHTASKPVSWRKRMNAHMAGTTLFYAETDRDQDTSGTAGEFGLRVMMRPLASVSAAAASDRATSSSGSIAFFEELAESALPSTEGVPDGIVLSDSNYRLVITGLGEGASTTVTIDTGAALPEGWRVVKFDGSDWMELPATAVGATSFAFQLTDGGAGDADGVANGMIVDPVSVGVLADASHEPVQVSGAGGGCVMNEGGAMDPLFPIMMLLAGVYLLRRRASRAVIAASLLALVAIPAQAADQDGDGIADDVEIAIGLDPEVSNSGTMQLTTATDALRFRPSVAMDADGNFHLAFVRFNKNTYISSADYTDVVYMMVAADGTVLIDETVINDDPSSDDASTTNVLVDEDGNVNVIWVSSNYLKIARLDPSAAAQDGSAGDMTDAEFALFGETDVDNSNSIYYIIYSHIAANDDFIVVSHYSMDVTRFSVDDAGVVTPVYTAVSNLTNVDNDGHSMRQAAFDADDNIHVIFQDCGSNPPVTDNCTMSYAVLAGSDASILSNSAALATGYATAPHGVFGNINLGSDGLLYTVWGDKRGTLDENNYCSFCGSRGTAWFAVLDPTAAATDGSFGDMTAIKAGDDVMIDSRWYISAYLDEDNNTHVFFNESMNLDHVMIDDEGNMLSAISTISSHVNTPNSNYRQSGNVTMAGNVAFFTQSGSTAKTQAGSGLFMKPLVQSMAAGDGSAAVSGGRLAFIEVVAGADLPDADGLPEGIVAGDSNYRLVIDGVQEGGAATITIDTGANLPGDMRVYKYDGDKWGEFQFTAVNDTSFSITVVDGGAGDADSVANGMIVDPVVVAQAAGPTVVTADGGGCVIGSGGRFDPLFPALLFLAGFYLLRRRMANNAKRSVAALVAGLMAVTAPLHAEEEGEADEDYFSDSKTFLTRNTYVGIMLGTPGSDADAGDLAGISSIVTVNNLDVDDGGTGYRIFFGKQLHDRVAFEIGFADLGDIDITADVGASDTDLFLQELAAVAPVAPAGFTLDAAGNYPLGADFSLIGRLGLFIWQSEVSFGPYQSSDDGVDLHFGLGGSYEINEHFDVRLEYESFQSTTKMDMFGLGVTYSF